MVFGKQMAVVAALGAALLIGSGLSAPQVQAGYIVTLEQVGSNVVATGSGTIDLTALHFLGTTLGNEPGLFPNVAFIVTGPTGVSATDEYTGFTGPFGFGSGGNTFASSGSGEQVGIDHGAFLFLPHNYVSGTSLSDTSTYDNQSFTTLGATPGTYVSRPANATPNSRRLLGSGTGAIWSVNVSWVGPLPQLHTAERMMHARNQASDLIDTDWVFADVTADNLGHQAGIDFLCTAVVGHYSLSNSFDQVYVG